MVKVLIRNPEDHKHSARASTNEALALLKVRLAKGEITIDEFEKIKSLIEG